MSELTVVHLFAGGIAGTLGAVITCPLEVIKTRLQSSVATFDPGAIRQSPFVTLKSNRTISIYSCFQHVIRTEGYMALFKGLGPNVVGVAPYRAIYFCTYAQTKYILCGESTKETPRVHMISAGTAGFVSSTITNPVWFIKTRLQLDQRRSEALTVRRCIANIYSQHGLRGFYKGIAASYYGISETIIYFVVYERLKQIMLNAHTSYLQDSHSAINFIEFMAAAALSKLSATCLTYPHEVARTRLRQEGKKYQRFWQTLASVVEEESIFGLYRGLFVHLLRQIPNTAVTMVTYELVTYLYRQYLL